MPKHLFHYLLLSCLLLALAQIPAAWAADGAELAKARFASLSRGVNVGWLNNRTFTLDREAAREEARVVRSVGCNHVRLYLNVDSLRDGADRVKPDPAKLPTLDAAIQIALDAKLAVIVDLFHYSNAGLIKFPKPDEPEAEAIVTLWGNVAKHLAGTDPERVFLEVANEPGLDNPQDWYAIELRTMKAIRQAAPHHTIIAGYNMKAGPTEWNGLKALTLFPACEDKNVIYNFHDYNPMAQTHQGASWSKGANRLLRGVPYPSSPENVAPLLEKLSDPAAQKMLRQYGQARWNREKMEQEVAVVADWAKARGVLVTCNEFGVHKPFALSEARVAWTRDMRLTFEKYGIGWTNWDGSFSFIDRKPAGKGKRGELVLEEPMVKALGLHMPDKI